MVLIASNHHHNKHNKFHASSHHTFQTHHQDVGFSSRMDLRFTFNQRHESYLEISPESRNIQTFLKPRIQIQSVSHTLLIAQIWDLHFNQHPASRTHQNLPQYGILSSLDLGFTFNQCHANYLRFLIEFCDKSHIFTLYNHYKLVKRKISFPSYFPHIISQ